MNICFFVEVYLYGLFSEILIVSKNMSNYQMVNAIKSLNLYFNNQICPKVTLFFI